MSNNLKKKVDVSVCLYGKPYHTILAIKSLLKHSREHINKIYVTVEKNQPQKDSNGMYLLKQVLKDEPIVYFKPKYFYNLGELDFERTRNDAKYRYQIPYQYAFEQSDQEYVLVIHNDCLFHDDAVGKMLDTFEKGPEKLAGTGAIGQCWVCPAAFENKCKSSTFDQYKPTKSELIEMMNRHDIPRREVTMRLINEDKIHPLPECRLNEHAALISTAIYRESSLPKGNNVTFAAGWGGNDWGTVWFHQMVNQGYIFKHHRLEDFATHSPFNSLGNGISAYSNVDIYWNSEELAKKHLLENYNVSLTPKPKTKVLSAINTVKVSTKRVLVKMINRFRK